MESSTSSQPNQPYSPINPTNLDMNFEELIFSQDYNYNQDYSMGHDDEDDSPVEEVSPIKPKKPSRRIAKAKKDEPKEVKKTPKERTVEEEIALCQGWYFENETGSTRGYDSIVSKWKNRVPPRIDAFCVIIKNIEANHESGTNDLDVYQKACAEYKMMYKGDFTLEHCYNILKDHPGWKNHFYQSQGRKKSKTSETTSGSASGGLNLNEEADKDVEETQEFQPMGRDRAKAKKKAAGSPRGGASSFVDLVVDKFYNMKQKKCGKKNKEQQSYIELKIGS
ncbi:protein kinase-like domain, concanavalin A-like lectin/glucanase domain protein [Tanacetum coccineum]|uniref:Protein kinase-like domain, concanavalin A-like lectin/glucanase domain protein n=1 Tax=Tanacetum coccineum TaxID=301880 RepID=A0ABQ4XDX7_9ASTR